MNELVQNLMVYALPILFAITLHEAAHAYAAKYFGDLTAYSQGRMSLNPIKHIDPIGTILIPVVLYFASSPFLFGYAKPVPVDFSRLRKPKRDMAWVALAGPAANLVMALMWMVLAILLASGNFDNELLNFFKSMAIAGIKTNLVIFAFNLFPIPPLDGGRILISLLPHKFAYRFAQIEPYGFFIVLGLAYLKIISFWMLPVMGAAYVVLDVAVSPLKFLLN